jgi:hypothetical protein
MVIIISSDDDNFFFTHATCIHWQSTVLFLGFFLGVLPGLSTGRDKIHAPVFFILANTVPGFNIPGHAGTIREIMNKT